ncbi:MAG: hypothetical protein L0I76_02385 [Pseudonocardia sp.]|nr:hypothetical protein [Pseudonocardia sp.]
MRWDELWRDSPRFRQMWWVSSLLWGLGTPLDSVLRIVLAYSAPPDLVPALGAALYAGTSAMLIVTTNVYYAASGVYRPDSAPYRAVRDGFRRLRRIDEAAAVRRLR